MEFISEPEQLAVPATWMRGGTSKALFFLGGDLPPPGPVRDRLLKRVMGCPHVYQVDGMGGARGNTSKIAIVSPSSRDDADVEYTFAQVGIGEDFIDFKATCGNISAGVGPFAVAKGLFHPTDTVAKIRIFNTNINEVIEQQFQVKEGYPRLAGDFVNAGVPGSGAEIFTDFTRAVGKNTGKMLPTERVQDPIVLADGRIVMATLLDVANPIAYVAAADLDLRGDEPAEALTGSIELMRAIAEIKDKATQMMGLTGNVRAKLGLVAPPSRYQTADGKMISPMDMDLCGRYFSLDYCAPNYSGTASISTGAAARIVGSTVYQAIPSPLRRSGLLRIGHPNGVMKVMAAARQADVVGGVQMERLGFGRTARTIMTGSVYVPQSEINDEWH